MQANFVLSWLVVVLLFYGIPNVLVPASSTAAAVEQAAPGTPGAIVGVAGGTGTSKRTGGGRGAQTAAQAPAPKREMTPQQKKLKTVMSQLSSTKETYLSTAGAAESLIKLVKNAKTKSDPWFWANNEFQLGPLECALEEVDKLLLDSFTSTVINSELKEMKKNFQESTLVVSNAITSWTRLSKMEVI